MESERAFINDYGLYDPQFEHESCGVGLIVRLSGEKSQQIVCDALGILNRMSHRGARGADPDTGDGAGILTQIPHNFFSFECE
ncbi:MAG TPA: hypothetical protein VEV84_09910, partial [Pyrinomonadaceae bacterium]|nr:hypothetical protein [Pyrinomonadaceae bacterium]